MQLKTESNVFRSKFSNQNVCTSLELLGKNVVRPIFFTFEQFGRVYDAHPIASQMVKFLGFSQRVKMCDDIQEMQMTAQY